MGAPCERAHARYRARATRSTIDALARGARFDRAREIAIDRARPRRDGARPHGARSQMRAFTRDPGAHGVHPGDARREPKWLYIY